VAGAERHQLATDPVTGDIPFDVEHARESMMRRIDEYLLYKKFGEPAPPPDDLGVPACWAPVGRVTPP
jgi:hypothetical protein